MGLLADMKTLLTAIETNIYIGDLPDTPDSVMVLYRSGGEDPEHSFDAREFQNPTFQVRIRNTSYATLETKAQAVCDALDGLTERTINGTRYLSIMQQGDVLSIGKDARNRSEMTVNFRVRHL